MAPSERTEGTNPADKPTTDEGFALFVNPHEPPQRTDYPDGGFTIYLKGEIHIAYRPPVAAVPESPVRDAEEQTGTLIPESTQSPLSEPYSAAHPTSQNESTPAETAAAREEQENQKYELVGNPVRDPSYRVRKSGKRIADFVLATHPEEEKTEYWRIRAFDRQAEKVRDQVRKGQTGVEATVYGPKQWQSRRKTKDGSWEETEVTGYYAGFVKVPKKYRSQEQAGEQRQQQQKD